ncbi:hypothetical protein [Paenibacillus sp. MABNR03]
MNHIVKQQDHLLADATAAVAAAIAERMYRTEVRNGSIRLYIVPGASGIE